MRPPPCSAGRNLVRDDDADWSTPCDSDGVNPVYLTDEAMCLYLCMRHVELLDGLGLTSERAQ